MKNALALSIEAAQVRDNLDASLAFEAMLRESAGFLAVAGPLEASVCRLRFCLREGSNIVQSVPVAAEPQRPF